MDGIHDTPLMKPFMVYSLAQAVTHVVKRVPKFDKLFKSPQLRSINLKAAIPNLTALAVALNSDEYAAVNLLSSLRHRTKKQMSVRIVGPDSGGFARP